MSISERIKLKRKQDKVSMPELSTLLGIPQDRLYKWERGVSEPKHEDRVQLEKWLKSEKVPIYPELNDPGEPEKLSGDEVYKDKYIRMLEEKVKEAKGLDAVLKSLEEFSQLLRQVLSPDESGDNKHIFRNRIYGERKKDS